MSPCTALPDTSCRAQITFPSPTFSNAKTPPSEPTATTSRVPIWKTTGVAPTSRSRRWSGVMLCVHSLWPDPTSNETTASSGLPTPTKPWPALSMAAEDQTPEPGAQLPRRQRFHLTAPVARSSATIRPAWRGVSPYGDATPTMTVRRWIAGDDHMAGRLPGAAQSHSFLPLVASSAST